MYRQFAIPTPDGAARAYFFNPEGTGSWPAVIFYMDAPAIRPALFSMCERLAANGYAVVLPDLFWRAGPYDPIDVNVVFHDQPARRALFGRLMSTTSPRKALSDTGAILDWLSARPEVMGLEVGVTGYCMGAAHALRAAATFPDRIVAAAGFHGGNLASNSPESPHLLASRIKARIYIGGADQDSSFPPQQAARLREALDAAGVRNTVEIYAGAQHGFAPPDMPVYNETAAERHWTALLSLFRETLGRG
jgi:carboxymethylenebutenolidase